MTEQRQGLSLDVLAKPIAEVAAKAGKVYVYRADGMLLKRHRALRQLEPEDRARRTLPLVASSVLKTSFLGERTPLPDAILEALDEREIAEIAQAFGQGAHWVASGGSGDARVQLEQPSVLAQQENETALQFFDRIVESYSKHEKELTLAQRAKAEKLLQSSADELLAPLRESGDRLSAVLKAEEASREQSHIRFQDHVGEMQRRADRERDRDRKIAEESAEMLKELGKAADVFLARFDARDQASDLQFKTQLRWAVGSLILSAVLSIVGAGFAAASYFQDKGKNDADAQASQSLESQSLQLKSFLVEQSKTLQQIQRRIDAEMPSGRQGSASGPQGPSSAPRQGG